MIGWRTWLPALLLALVATVQVVLAKTAALSPWKGGGFGMFATTDGLASRHVRLFVEAADRSEEIDISSSLEDAATRAALFPSDRLLTDLAQAVVLRESRRQRPVRLVRVDVSRVQFDGQGLAATERRLRTITFVVPRDAL